MAFSMRPLFKSSRARAGITLIELMIAAAVLAIGILGFISAFGGIARTLKITRGRSLAVSLAQEQVENLKNKSYYLLLVTTATATDTRFSPNLVYDDGAYAKENITVGDVPFERATRVDLATIVGNSVSTVPYTNEDTGLKKISVYVFWEENGENKKLELTNLMENPDINPLNGAFNGTVTSSTGGFVHNAKIEILGNPQWSDLTDMIGAYDFQVNDGSYTLKASKQGFYTAFSDQVSLEKGDSITKNFTLTPISSGTVSGYAWINNAPVLSRVMGSSETYAFDATQFYQEWVEIFNPTTFTWTVDGFLGLNFQRAQDAAKHSILIDYKSSTLGAGGYYIFANTTPVQTADGPLDADAVWSTANTSGDFPKWTAAGRNIILVNGLDGGSEGGGAIELVRLDNNNRLDVMGWDRNGSGLSAPMFETEGLDENIGLEDGEQYYRHSSTAGYSATLGPAYDSNDNDKDWERDAAPSSYAPRNTQSAAGTVIAGKPAIGAIVSAEDTLSVSTRAYSTTANGLRVAQFDLTDVATGFWRVSIGSGSLVQEISLATVTDGGRVWVPNALTTPAEPATSRASVFLSTEGAVGYITGTVYDTGGSGVPTIKVFTGGQATTTGPNGSYFLQVSTGYTTIYANYSNENSAYTEETANVTVETGEVESQDITIFQGGTLMGYVTSGVTPLLNVIVNAVRDGNIAGTAVTNTGGNFYIQNLATGTYTMEAITDPNSTASPASISADALVNATVHVGTFTISGAYGTISGTVKYGSDHIGTGVLILASKDAVSATPPDVYGSSASLTTVVYAGTSLSDGTYSILVRGSTTYTYNMRAFYTTIDGIDAVTTSKTASSVSVSPGGGATQDFLWP